MVDAMVLQKIRTALAAAACLAAFVSDTPPVAAAQHAGGVAQVVLSHDRWTWPLDPVPHVVRYFEPPRSPYGPGHRGVDLAGEVAQPVLSIGAGTVSFAGSVAGRGIVVVDHGRLRSTYEPVTARVAAGDIVVGGQLIGFLQLPHSHCAPAACQHLGVRRADAYVDPLTLLGPRPVRLKPWAGLPDDPPAGPEGRGLVLPDGGWPGGRRSSGLRVATAAGLRAGLEGGAAAKPRGCAGQARGCAWA